MLGCFSSLCVMKSREKVGTSIWVVQTLKCLFAPFHALQEFVGQLRADGLGDIAQTAVGTDKNTVVRQSPQC